MSEAIILRVTLVGELVNFDGALSIITEAGEVVSLPSLSKVERHPRRSEGGLVKVIFEGTLLPFRRHSPRRIEVRAAGSGARVAMMVPKVAMVEINPTDDFFASGGSWLSHMGEMIRARSATTSDCLLRVRCAVHEAALFAQGEILLAMEHCVEVIRANRPRP